MKLPVKYSHTNGFVAFPVPLEGTEEFDLGLKFEERESDHFLIDPHTGIRALAEPSLALYVSVFGKGSDQVPKTLNFARTRSCFISGLHPTSEDRHQMLQAAIPRIISDLKLLRSNKIPESNVTAV